MKYYEEIYTKIRSNYEEKSKLYHNTIKLSK